MRIASLKGRAVLIGGTNAIDIDRASGGRFGSDPQALYGHWSEFRDWAASIDVSAHAEAEEYDGRDLGAPVPRPRQVFGVGLNYADHAVESKMELPENPLVFTKFPSSITGPDVDVRLSGDRVDWEAELVVVIGVGGRDIHEVDAWQAVAGLTVGQDLSDRTVQNLGKPAQFNLGKSFADYGPIGPAVVTLDEVRAVADPEALSVTCWLSESGSDVERVLQDGNTRDLIFTVPQLVSRLSAIVELLPGDLIFTGTPSGVGLGRDPQEFLKPGQRLTTKIEALGTLVQRFRR
jgi:2,4-diketo-3-deoxy-L-fuconate hydrolase